MFATALFARDHPQITFTANGGWPICAVYLISASCWASSVRLPYRVHIPHYPIRHSSIALKAARQALIQADTPAEWNTRQLRKPFLTDCSTLISIARRVYTFWLRHGVKFHVTPWFMPSHEFNGEDVVFTFERMRNLEMPFRKAYLAEFPYWHYTGFDQLVEKIELPDRFNPYIVRFTLKSPNAVFLSNLAAPPASILSAEYAAQLLKSGAPSDMNRRPVGTGPFIFEKYVKDESIRYAGNPEYWKPEDVKLSKLVFSIIPEAAVRVQKLKSNECQISVYPRLVDIAALQSDPNIEVLSKPAFGMSYVAYNVTHPPLDKVLVRRALDMAINKKAIIDAVYEGRAQAAVAPMPPVQWAYDKSLKDAPRNSKRAKAFLTQAGYPNGFKITLWAPSLQRPYNPSPKLMAEMIQSDWAKIGVKADIVQRHDFADYIKRTGKGEHDAMLAGKIIDNGDVDNWLGEYGCRGVGTANYSLWCYKPFDDLVQQAVHITDLHQRTQRYLKAQKIFKQEQPFTPIAYPIVYQPIRKNVTGFRIHPFGPTQFNGVSLR